MFRRRLRAAALPLAGVALAALVLVAGATALITARLGGDAAFGLDLATVARALAPGVGGTLAAGLRACRSCSCRAFTTRMLAGLDPAGAAAR